MHSHLTLVGNLVADPTLRYLDSGTAVTNLRLATTARRRRDRQWEDGETTFLDCIAWDLLAENVAESLSKGDRVVAVGKLTTKRWTGEDGNERSSTVLDLDAIAADLTFATVTITRLARSSRASDQQNGPHTTPEATNA